MFCKSCKGILKKKADGVLICISCSKECSGSLPSIELKGQEKKEVAIINQKGSEVLPKIHHKCLKCGCKEAYFWHHNGIGDEAEVVFYRCVKCNYTIQSGGQRGGR